MAADVPFNFTFPTCEAQDYSFDATLFQMPYQPTHTRSSSRASVYSADSIPDTVSTRMSTPPRASPPVRHHGPILLPKIRPQDQAIDGAAITPAKRAATSASPAPRKMRKTHARSYTMPETMNFPVPFAAPQQQQQQQQQPEEQQQQLGQSLLCSPATFTTPTGTPTPEPRRASSCGVENTVLERYGFPTYRQMPTYMPAPPAAEQQESFMYIAPTDYPRNASPLHFSPEPTPTTTLLSYLTAPNPAPSLVRTISYRTRDPNTKHFWWDVRQVRPWNTFAQSVLSLPAAPTLLTCPVAAPLLPTPPTTTSRHPETEAALHSIYAQHYLPRLNAALAASSTRPLTLSVPPKPATATAGPADHLFVANGPGESTSAAALFGGRPSARAVGLVRAFDRFNTGMRAEGAVKRVEYLRGLAALHHAMREHSCRLGFILTEIELVVVRNGSEAVPHFGFLEVTSIPLASPSTTSVDIESLQSGEAGLTACLALWGLCMLASDDVHMAAPGAFPSWRSEIGAPAEGTRRRALPRDSWMPAPQLAEKREAKRARGWVLPEDPVGRKELGKRGVRYAAC